jgi:hypothetical protein
MKKYKINRNFLFLMVLIAGISFSCKKDKESENISKVTTFVKIDLTGGLIYSHTLNTPYSEPGYKATDIAAGNKDVTTQVTVDGEVDPSEAGVYPITYTVKNTDGFTTEVVRQVVVFDNTSVSPVDLAGTYNSKVYRTNTSSGASATRPAADNSYYTITIKKITTGLFEIDDFLGGWYWIGSAYGADYAYNGLFVLKADNTIAFVSADMSKGWEDGIILDQNAGDASKYNPVTGQISIVSYMGTSPTLRFALTLTKQPE